jgi:hypothetical protein
MARPEERPLEIAELVQYEQRVVTVTAEVSAPLPRPPVCWALETIHIEDDVVGRFAEETGKALEAVVQSHIDRGAALLAQDRLDHEVELETLGGAMLGVDGTAGVILVLPLEATITEVNERTEPKIEAIPVSAIVFEVPQDAVVGAETLYGAYRARADSRGDAGRA